MRITRRRRRGGLGLLQTVRSRDARAYVVCIIGPLLSGSDLTTIEGTSTTSCRR